MISRFTPPGTKVVCINANGNFRFAIRDPKRTRGDDLDGLTQWEIYTVKEILEDKSIIGGFGVTLVEIIRPERCHGDPGCYAPQRFKPAVLPKEFIEALTSTPSENLCDLIRKSKELERV